MRLHLLLLFALGTGLMANAQDLTGTWEGELVKNGNAFEGIQRKFRLTWEIVQIEKEVYGIVYFFPQDTRPSDKPLAWYTWYGKQGKKSNFPFQFIQGRYVEGLGTTTTFQFNVQLTQSDSAEILSGNWYSQLEALHSRERPAGTYTVRKVSPHVSDQLWLKRKEKEIIEKLEKQRTFSR